MPIYEYTCDRCGAAFTVLKLSVKDEATACPSCGAKEARKKLSTFSCSVSGGHTGGGPVSVGG